MRVKINKAGSDDESGGVKDFGVAGGNVSSGRDFGDVFAIEQDVEGSVGFSCRVEHASVFDQEHTLGSLYISGAHDAWGPRLLFARFVVQALKVEILHLSSSDRQDDNL